MKILLVDNHSKHRQALIELFGNHATVETQEQLSNTDPESYDLVVLSGGTNIPSVLYTPDAYSREMELVRDAKIPVLGICLGSEIITKAFGGTLQDLGSVHRGNVELTIVDVGLEETLNGSSLEAYEAHRVGVKNLPQDFLVCAYSNHGPEIIKHKTKPVMGVQFHVEVNPNVGLVEWIMKSLK